MSTGRHHTQAAQTGPRHSNSQSKTPWVAAAMIASVPAGLLLLIFAVAEGMSYSPYGNPGAGSRAVMLLILGVLLVGIPGLAAFVELIRRYSNWKKTLTPGERLALSVGELAGLEAARLAARHHNHEVSARLTESAMGEPRTDDGAC